MQIDAKVPYKVSKLVTDTNALALKLMNKGEIEESGVCLRKLLAILESTNWSTLDESSEGTPLGYLRVLTFNTEASWWRCRGDFTKALDVLKRALDEIYGVSLRQVATTHSNICAVLSKVRIGN